MLKICLPLAVVLALAHPLRAEIPGDVADLYEAMRIDAVVAIMAEEGADYGDELRTEMFPGQGGTSWDQTVADIYDAEAMRRAMREGFAEALGDTETAPLTGFFTSDLGARIIRLEIDARQAMVDEDVEAAAEERAAELQATDAPRHAVLTEYIEANELLESNVSGALNANFDFYQGLLDGAAFDGTLSEEQVLRDVWSQEPEIRADTEEWLYAYLGLAYRPLTDAELRRYIDISETPEGQALNRALFAAFDEMYGDISRKLGRAAAQLMAGQDI